MPSLREIQSAFMAELLIEQPLLSASGRVAAGPFRPDERIQLYRNNLFVSLTDALGAAYPVVKRLVGDGFFGYMANRYIKRYPSQSGNLHDFGAELANFVGGFEAAASLPYLADVAHLEWARHRAYHEATCECLDYTALLEVPPDRYGELRFRLNPGAGLVSSRYPILQIWSFNQTEEHRSSLRLESGGERVLVLRRSGEIAMKSLGKGEHAFLTELQGGAMLGPAVDAALALETEFDLEGSLREHVAMGTVTAIDL